MKGKGLVLFLSLCLVCGFAPLVDAGSILQNAEMDGYWWYYSANHQYRLAIPAKADRYISKQLFGMSSLEMLFHDGETSLLIQEYPANDVSLLRNSVLQTWDPLSVAYPSFRTGK